MALLESILYKVNTLRRNHMSVQELRNGQGHVIGRIRTAPNGFMEITDPRGQVQGRYNPTTNETRDKQGHLVGKGNLLTTLL
jgi:hypothetical protein